MVLPKSFVKSLWCVTRIHTAFQNTTFGYPKSCFVFLINIFQFYHGIFLKRKMTDTWTWPAGSHALPSSASLLGSSHVLCCFSDCLPDLMGLSDFLWWSLLLLPVLSLTLSPTPTVLCSFPWRFQACSWLQVLSLCWWLSMCVCGHFLPAELQHEASSLHGSSLGLPQTCVKFQKSKTAVMNFLPKHAASPPCLLVNGPTDYQQPRSHLRSLYLSHFSQPVT